MRVMVSLNLADIMTATRPTTPHETNNDAAPVEPSQEFDLPSNSEQMKINTESIELAEKL